MGSCLFRRSSSIPLSCRPFVSSASSGPRPFRQRRFLRQSPGATCSRAPRRGAARPRPFCCRFVHQLIDRPRRTTRALVLTPTRELAAQILEDLNALAVHTPVTRCRGVRRRRHGAAGARLSKRRGRHHRDARPAARSLPIALCQVDRHRVPRAGRSRSHARHGVSAGHSSRASSHPDEASDDAVQRDDASPHREAGGGHAEGSRLDQSAAPGEAGDRHRAGGVPGVAGPEGAAARAVAGARHPAGGARVYPDQASCEPSGRPARAAPI